MVTAAEIQSIDFNSNSCVVRIPFFETAGTLEPFISTAKICIQPGIYNGYQIGDTVWVDFINGDKEWPIVVGKIFKNQEEEKTSTGSVIVSPSIEISSHASIPNETEILNAPFDFDTIQKIINNIKDIQENIDDKNKTWDIYSEDEQQIGYWIDGKALYRKTFVKDISITGPASISELFDLSNLNYDLIWVDGSCTFAIGDIYSTGVAYYKDSQDWFYTYIRHADKKLIASGVPVSDNTITKIVITVKYTKV